MEILLWLSHSKVTLQSDSGKTYTLDSKQGKCSCPHNTHRKLACKHLDWFRDIQEQNKIKNKLHKHILSVGVACEEVLNYSFTKKNMLAVVYSVNGGKGCMFVNPTKLPEIGLYTSVRQNGNVVLMLNTVSKEQFSVSLSSAGYIACKGTEPTTKLLEKQQNSLYKSLILAEKAIKTPLEILDDAVRQLKNKGIYISKTDTLFGVTYYLSQKNVALGFIGYTNDNTFMYGGRNTKAHTCKSENLLNHFLEINKYNLAK
jgi:hypothetical protein